MTQLQSYLNQIQLHYPDLILSNARLVDVGQFSIIVIIDEAYVFRFPRTIHVAKELQQEIPKLQALQNKLPLPIPNPSYIAFDKETGDLTFMGYAMLPGEPLLREQFQRIDDVHIRQQIAEELANFLKILHSLPKDLLPSPNESISPRVFWEQTLRDFQQKLYPYMRHDARKQVTETFKIALENENLWDFETVVCHGDLGSSNILYKDGHISGIIDFTFCAVDDPAQDLGALLVSYGRNFIERILLLYPELRRTLLRTEFIITTYALLQALYALRDGNQEDFDDGMKAYI